MKTKELARLALLTALAVALHWLESLLPRPLDIPGVKLGLSNLVTLFALWTLGWEDAGLVLAARVLLSGLYAGFGSLFFSAGGGACALAAGALLRRVLSERQLWVAGVLMALAHVLGQLAVAAVLLENPYMALYLPVLLVTAPVSGAFTGLCAQFLVLRGEKLWKTYLN